MTQGQCRLDHRADAGGDLRVANHRLQAAQGTVAVFTGASQGGVQRLYFDAVAKLRGDAMGLHVRQARRLDLSPRQCLVDRLFHALGIRRRERNALAAVSHATALENSVDIVLVGDRLFQALEDQDTDPFRTHEPIGTGLERPGFAIAAEEPHRPQIDRPQG
ncbi:hypothetical protein D3C78_647440 [compost metagenome]